MESVIEEVICPTYMILALDGSITDPVENIKLRLFR